MGDQPTNIFIGAGSGGANPQHLELKRANRHGLIAGATGTGKTVTLQGIVEGLSAVGVPTFVADVKGDLAGLAMPGDASARVHEPFTARAAGEMRTRLRTLGVGGVQARTFHAAALRQLHYFWPQAVGGAAPEILPYKAPVVAEAASRLRMQFDRTAIRDLSAEVEWAKVTLLTPESYAAHARSAGRDPAGIDLREMARLFET